MLNEVCADFEKFDAQPRHRGVHVDVGQVGDGGGLFPDCHFLELFCRFRHIGLVFIAIKTIVSAARTTQQCIQQDGAEGGRADATHTARDICDFLTHKHCLLLVVLKRPFLEGNGLQS